MANKRLTNKLSIFCGGHLAAPPIKFEIFFYLEVPKSFVVVSIRSAFFRSKPLSLEFISVPPSNSQPPTGLIVTLHGWGANADDVASLLPFVNLANYHFVFPNAPYPYPYAPLGKAWYDLRQENMYDGLPESRQQLIDLLQSLESTTGVPLSRTILSGFSQGGAMTLDVGLRLPLAGLVVISGYLHPNIEPAAKNDLPPILIAHGTVDEVVPLQSAIKARDALQSLGAAVEYHEFDVGHEIHPKMLGVLRNFVGKAIG